MNKKSKRPAQRAFILYNLKVEYLSIFDEEFQQRWGVDQNFDRDYEYPMELENWLKEYKK